MKSLRQFMVELDILAAEYAVELLAASRELPTEVRDASNVLDAIDATDGTELQETAARLLDKYAAKLRQIGAPDTLFIGFGLLASHKAFQTELGEKTKTPSGFPRTDGDGFAVCCNEHRLMQLSILVENASECLAEFTQKGDKSVLLQALGHLVELGSFANRFARLLMPAPPIVDNRWVSCVRCGRYRYDRATLLAEGMRPDDVNRVLSGELMPPVCPSCFSRELDS